ncbi:MAG: citrate/2-methylcitrate synthase [Spirochaetaceae bacterium]|jgi:citrate synthase|nr:citrate/2-methylcitrate synthase [Spirochaetaceae bacterium]
MNIVSEYAKGLSGSDYIDASLYGKYNVKRGLRNDNNSGVLVGLTRIGEVHGYIISEGEKLPVDGKLFYRGIDVEDIVNNVSLEGRFGFEEVVYLLLFGELPDADRLDEFMKLINLNRVLPQGFAEDSIMKIPSRDIMNKLACSVLTLYSYDDKPECLSVENVLRQCMELIARFPTIAAYAYRAKRHYFNKSSLIIHQLNPDYNTAETILSLVRSDRQFTRFEAEALDLALILHAEHGGGNNSTFSIHLVTSAATDVYSAISAGLASLKGAKHGGANYKVVGMVEAIKHNVKKLDNDGELRNYLVKILKRQAFDKTGIIYGLGHAVYTVSDPRAVILREKAARLASEKNCMEEFELYRRIEKIVPDLIKEVKGSKKDICANVDLYSGFVYKMLDIPAELYTPIFAISRVAGWCAHLLEEIVAGGQIIRPAYKCVQEHKKYVRLGERGASASPEN